jgi:arginine decarboxylase
MHRVYRGDNLPRAQKDIIPVIMPGERITRATKSIQDNLLYARELDQKFPGFETDIHGLRFESAGGGRRYEFDCIPE